LRLRRYRAKLRTLAIAPLVWSLRGEGLPLESIADELNSRGIEAPGKRIWHTSTVSRVLSKTQSEFAEVAATFVPLRSRTTAFRSEARTRTLAPLVWELRALGQSTREIAKELSERGIQSPRTRGHCSAISQLLRQTAQEFRNEDALASLNKPKSRFAQRRASAMVLAPQIWDLLAEGKSRQQVADVLNERNIQTPRKRRWHHSSVQNLLDFIADAPKPNPATVAAIRLARLAAGGGAYKAPGVGRRSGSSVRAASASRADRRQRPTK